FLNTSTRGRLEAAERGIRSARTHPGNGTTSDCGLTSGRHSTSTSEIPIEFTQHPTEHHFDTQAIKSSFRRRKIDESIHHAKYRYTSEPLLESVQEPFGHVDRQTDVVTAVLDEDRESDVSPPTGEPTVAARRGLRPVLGRSRLSVDRVTPHGAQLPSRAVRDHRSHRGVQRAHRLLVQLRSVPGRASGAGSVTREGCCHCPRATPAVAAAMAMGLTIVFPCPKAAAACSTGSASEATEPV